MTRGRARVLIAGGGPAALETALALQSWAPDDVHVTLLAPAARFVYPPLAVKEPFAPTPALTRPLSVLAAAAGATLIQGELASVDAERRRIRTVAGRELDYDALVVAIGARTIRHLAPPAVMFAGPADAAPARSVLDAVVRDALAGRDVRIAFVVPPGPGWPLAVYELALASAHHLELEGAAPVAQVALLTPESRPLTAFGEVPSAAVAEDLAAARVELHVDCEVRSYDGALLRALGGQELPADHVIALARLHGPEVPGLPHDGLGFVHCDQAHGRVEGVERVYAVGDAASFPIKQGGLACQQADAAASAICAELGVEAESLTFKPVLRAALWTGEGHRYMRCEVTGGHEESIGVTSRRDELWTPEAKIAGRFLTGLLDARPGEELTDWAPRTD